MARVDHKKIRQLIAQKQKTVTDRQFFSSRAFAAYFADMALAQTRRYGYHRRVKVRTVWEPKNGNTAMTNNELIWLNAGHPSITQHKSRAERYAQLCGLFAHELGHVLHSSARDNSTEYRKRANFPESIEFSGISLYYTNEVYECPCNFAIRASFRTFE